MVIITNLSNKNNGTGTVNNKVGGIQRRINNTSNVKVAVVTRPGARGVAKKIVYRGVNVVVALTLALSAYHMQSKAYQIVGNLSLIHI